MWHDVCMPVSRLSFASTSSTISMSTAYHPRLLTSSLYFYYLLGKRAVGWQPRRPLPRYCHHPSQQPIPAKDSRRSAWLVATLSFISPLSSANNLSSRVVPILVLTQSNFLRSGLVGGAQELFPAFSPLLSADTALAVRFTMLTS